MAIDDHLIAWRGTAFRYVPAGAANPLDFRYAGRGFKNRWNTHGQPTLYLAGDEGVLIAEWGRHFAVDRDSRLRSDTDERAVYRLFLTIDHLVDLRQAAVWEALSLSTAPMCFLDLPVARAIAQFIRQTTSAQGLVVPSAAFLDRLDRWCLVLFLDKLPTQAREWITAVEPIGTLRRPALD